MSDAKKQGGGDGPGADGGDLPKLDFSTFILSIIGSAYVHLGDAPSPVS